MSRPASTWLRPMPLAAIGLLSLALLVWFVGPLLAIGADRPFETESSRVALTAVIVVLWGAAQGWRRWRRWRSDEMLLRALASGADADLPQAESARQASASAGALGSMRGLPLFGTDAAWPLRRSIAERPCYVLLGDTGVDRAAMLAGLGSASRVRQAQAVAASAAGSASDSSSKAPGFDWWFFEQVAVIDASWIVEDLPHDETARTKAWNRLFARIDSTRAHRPVDGVVLMVSAAELLQEEPTSRGERSAALREALQQVNARARTGVPVVMLVTDLDRMEGFRETLDDAGSPQTDRPWGFELPRGFEARSPASGFDAGYTRLAESLRERGVGRMEASSEAAVRAAVYLFEQEFAALHAALAAFAAAVLPDESSPRQGCHLHGVYFTGATRSTGAAARGSLPTGMSRSLQREFGIEPGPAATAASPSEPAGDLFLKRLLNEVMLAEPGLARRREAAERRRSHIRVAGYAVLAVAATALVTAWLASFSRNIGYVAEVRSRPAEIRRSIDSLPPATNGDVTPLPAILSAVRNLAAPDGFKVDEAPLFSGFGLYQGDKLDAAALIGYEHLLDHALMPRISHRLEERLRGAGSDNLEQAYEALKSYLMLYTPDKFDADSLGAWIRVDWDGSNVARLPADERAALDRHLDAMLRRGAPKAVAPIDMALVTRTRNVLAEYPLESRVYNRLKRLSAGSGLPDFTLAGAAGPQAAAVFARVSGQPISRGIPGLYTRDGYEKAFQASIDSLTLQLANEESWVLGIGASDGRGGVAGAVNAAEAAARRAREIAGGQLSNRVRRLYFDDFIRQWDAYIADVRLVNIDSLDKARLLAQTLSGTDSPLLSLTRAIARETSLTPVAGIAGRATAALSTALDKAAASRNDAARRSGTEPAASDVGAPTGQVEKLVDDHFAAFHRLVDGKRAPIEQSLRLFDRLNAQLSEIDLAQRRRAPLPAPAGLMESKVAASGQPEPIRSMLQSLVGTGMAALSSPLAPSGSSQGAPAAARSPRSP